MSEPVTTPGTAAEGAVVPGSSGCTCSSGGGPCYQCRIDRAAILCAAGALRRRGWDRKLVSGVIVRALERYADRLVRRP